MDLSRWTEMVKWWNLKISIGFNRLFTWLSNLVPLCYHFFFIIWLWYYDTILIYYDILYSHYGTNISIVLSFPPFCCWHSPWWRTGDPGRGLAGDFARLHDGGRDLPPQLLGDSAHRIWTGASWDRMFGSGRSGMQMWSLLCFVSF